MVHNKKGTGTKNPGEKKGVLAVAGVFISLMVGAGFASGRELYVFFVRYGTAGIIGLFVSILILTLCGWAVMDITYRSGFRGYDTFMETVMGKRLGTVMVGVANVYIFVMMSAMFSGFAAALNEAFGVGRTFGTLIIAGLCFVTFLFDLKGIVSVSSLLAPVLMVGGVFFGLYISIAGTETVSVSFEFGKSVVWPALLYASYNMITTVSVLSALGGSIVSRAAAKKAAILSGAGIAVLGLAFFLPMYMDSSVLGNLPLPLLYLAERHSGVVTGVYLVVFLAAIFTTAVSGGFAIIEHVAAFADNRGITKLTVKVLVTAAGICLAHAGFNTFIEKVYPLFGFIGLFEMVTIIAFAFCARRTPVPSSLR